MCRIPRNIRAFILMGLIISFNTSAVTLPDLAPPVVLLVDEFGVNLMNGQVTHQLETVSIGNATGLSHSISSYTNNFSMKGYYGYQDKYYGKGRVSILKNSGTEFLDVIQVNDFQNTANFTVMVNGQQVRADSQISSGYTYHALGDTRHSLERKQDGYIYWTKPDGTVSKFLSGTHTYPSSIGLLVQVTYPNGYTIDIDWVSGKVTSNTGFALKYIYQFDEADRYMDSSKPNLPTTQIPPVNPEAWAQYNPKYIQAINTAKENCLIQTCTSHWPKAEFDWPGGMPRSIFLGYSELRVIDAMGGETKFYFRSYDLAYDEHGGLVSWKTPNTEFSPRLIGIKPAQSTSAYYQYTYKNATESTGSNNGSETSWVHITGKVVNSMLGNEVNAYGIGTGYYSTTQNTGNGNVRRVIPSTDRPGTVSFAELIDGTLDYEPTWRNLLKTYTKNSGDKEIYEYDTRGNLIKVTKNGTWISGEYPSTCPESTRKYCNKPTWTSDAKGNKTWFTYHPQSGELETITYPANKNGIVRKIRYEYAQKQAYYYASNGNRIYGSPIWLKTAERTCAKTNTINNVCEGTNDEVITRYEYNSDNLFLTGITVTAADGNNIIITKRTCYQYDQYGNKIGEIEPKANLTQCAQ
ncbi:hypothetical protein [Cellvibrio japonicus]|nr:hypothetical protein [Cellvibrio japonicus]QEI11852.1 hypothetical protein FY117_06160 [Cellvibrio japonicus]QEI15426.1 hypothetical protein FY116_06160 [Cellvibrio japonicus]QEI19005.1 hypothetical protein FY115_06160 [Cellvibrio japonicus]